MVGREDFLENPVGVIDTNFIGTRNLLELAREKNVTGFLYLSTREIYGEPVSENTFVSEDEYGVVNPLLVRSCYPESKRMAENLSSCYHYQYGIPMRIVRLGHVFGPEYSFSIGRVWEDFLKMAASGNDIILNSDGSLPLAFTHVRDAISGLFFALLNGDSLVYNLSDTSEIVSVKELAEIVGSLCPDKRLKVVSVISGENKGYLQNRVAFLDSDKLKSIGWEKDMMLKDGFERLLSYYNDMQTHSF